MSNQICRSCNGKNLIEVISLGDQAWCNNFLQKDQLGTEKTYPLTMMMCSDCTLCQLGTTVPKEVMFSNHTYLSGTTKSLSEHFYQVARRSSESLSGNDLVVDIGGNDGTQLLQYKRIGFNNVLNIESASNIAKISSNNGIKTINEFFNEEVVDRYNIHNVSLINASGVFFHLEELHSVIKGIYKSLRNDGVFVVQFMYLLDMLNQGTFDGIYHEHLCYYSLRSISNLLEPYGLYLFDAYHSEIHGGSMIAKFGKKKPEEEPEILANEEIISESKLRVFAESVRLWRDKFKEQILNLKNNGRKIYAFGSPAKGNTLLTYSGLDKSIIDYVFEVNKMKCGLYTPVTHIPIVYEDHSLIQDNSRIVLLSWNFADEIMSKSQDLINKGVKFILPFKEQL